MLYTAANNAGGSPDALAARLRAEGVVLAVVTTAEDDAYWAAVAAGTCGVAVRARSTAVVDAFAQVTTELRTRFLVTLPAPARAAPAVVQVGPRSADVEIPTSSDGGVDSRDRPGGGRGGRGGAGARGRRDRPSYGGGRSRCGASRDPATPSVDRGPVLAAIENALAAGGPVVVRAADGRAGLGVTTAMVEFAHRYRDAYDVAWWIAAQDPQLIADQMAQLAEALGVAAPTDTAEQATAAALAALRERGRWLVVFDDAGSRRDLARFLPEGAGHVLVGSADPEWGAREVAVPPFSRAESVGLLQARRDGPDGGRGRPRGGGARGRAPRRRRGGCDARGDRDERDLLRGRGGRGGGRTGHPGMPERGEPARRRRPHTKAEPDAPAGPDAAPESGSGAAGARRVRRAAGRPAPGPARRPRCRSRSTGSPPTSRPRWPC